MTLQEFINMIAPYVQFILTAPFYALILLFIIGPFIKPKP